MISLYPNPIWMIPIHLMTSIIIYPYLSISMTQRVSRGYFGMAEGEGIRLLEFEALHHALQQQGRGHVAILGDFNTPSQNTAGRPGDVGMWSWSTLVDVGYGIVVLGSRGILPRWCWAKNTSVWQSCWTTWACNGTPRPVASTAWKRILRSQRGSWWNMVVNHRLSLRTLTTDVTGASLILSVDSSIYTFCKKEVWV